MTHIKKILLSGIVPLLMITTGCATTELLSDSDITVEDLEVKMAARVDREGNYKKSKSFSFRQAIRIPQFLDDDIVSMVETKMVMPDKFRVTTIDQDNEIVQVICSNGNRGWVSNIAAKKMSDLSGERLQQLLTLAKLATPAAGYRKIFKSVEIFRCSNDDGEFYLLKCVGAQGNTFQIYVDTDEFLMRRMKGRLKVGSGYLDYDSKILRYGLYNGVMIPKLTETVQNGQKQIIELLSYELNPNIPDSDFAPPVF